jgi:anti-sigma factor RsiW
MDRLDAWIDGDLPPSEDAVFETHLFSCEPCAASERRARAIADELRSLPELKPPERLLDAVGDITRHQARPAFRGTPRAHRSWMLAAAALLAAGLSAIIATSIPPSPDSADIDRAALEVRYALGVVTRANRAAGRELGETLNHGLPVEPTASRIGRVLEHARGNRPVEVDVHGG